MIDQLRLEGLNIELRQGRFAGTFDIEASDSDLIEQGLPTAFVVIVRPNGGSLNTNRKTGDTKWQDKFEIVDARVVDDEDLRDILVDRMQLEWPNELELTSGSGSSGTNVGGTGPSAGAVQGDGSDLPADPEFDVDPDDDPDSGIENAGPKSKPFNPADDQGYEEDREVLGSIHDYRGAAAGAQQDDGARRGREALESFVAQR